MVLASVSVSLDGHLAGPGVSPAQPMGAGGERLHAWLMDPTPADRAVADEVSDRVGAVVLGRRTFDVGLAQWGGDTPYPCPSFVVTHRPLDELRTQSASFEFLPDLLEAVERARAAAGDMDVILMGGEVTQRALDAGVVDELRIQLVPLVLGSGTRLFTGAAEHAFEWVEARTTGNVAHLRLRYLPGARTAAS